MGNYNGAGKAQAEIAMPCRILCVFHHAEQIQVYVGSVFVASVA